MRKKKGKRNTIKSVTSFKSPAILLAIGILVGNTIDTSQPLHSIMLGTTYRQKRALGIAPMLLFLSCFVLLTAMTPHTHETPNRSVLLFGGGNAPTLLQLLSFDSRSRGRQRHSSGRGCQSCCEKSWASRNFRAIQCDDLLPLLLLPPPPPLLSRIKNFWFFRTTLTCAVRHLRPPPNLATCHPFTTNPSPDDEAISIRTAKPLFTTPTAASAVPIVTAAANARENSGLMKRFIIEYAQKDGYCLANAFKYKWHL